jgi:hypothetical protein
MNENRGAPRCPLCGSPLAVGELSRCSMGVECRREGPNELAARLNPQCGSQWRKERGQQP